MTYVFLSTALPLSFLCLLHTHTSLGFIFKSYSFLLCGLPQQLHRNIYKHMNSLARPQRWFGVQPQEGKPKGWAGRDPNQAQTVPSICSSCAFPVWEPCWSQPWHNWCILSTECPFCHLFHCSQRNWKGPGSVLPRSEWNNGITAETKVIHSLALMFAFEFLFKSWIILQCIIRFLLAAFSACSHGWKANGNLISQENHHCMRWL